MELNMNRIKRILLLLLIATFVFCSGCSLRSSPDISKYTSYNCYDYHLACLKTEGRSGTAEVTKIDEANREVTDRVSFQKIIDVSDDQFVYANVFVLLQPPEKVVLQNPDNYVDVWVDWTIKKVDVFYVDLYKPIDQNKPAIIPNKIISLTDDSDIISELTEFVLADNYIKKFENPTGYSREYGSDYERVFYIRVYFNESENIVWDSKFMSFYSDELHDRIIFLDKGRTPNMCYFPSTKYVSLGKDTQLYKWMSEVIETLSDNN